VTADEYLEGWRAEWAKNPDRPWIEALHVDAAARWAAIDRALSPLPSIDDLRELRAFRRAEERFGPVVCNASALLLPRRVGW
jgi:hypothetical protein